MKHQYTPSGVCARAISVELDGDLVKEVSFVGGCDGNHKGLCALVKGMKADEVKERLSGITCGFRSTSCPDQLAKAVCEAVQNE